MGFSAQGKSMDATPCCHKLLRSSLWRHLPIPPADAPSILLLLLAEEDQNVPDPGGAHMGVPMSWWRDMSLQTSVSFQSRRRGIHGNILWLYKALETSRGQTHLFPSCYMFALEISSIYFPNVILLSVRGDAKSDSGPMIVIKQIIFWIFFIYFLALRCSAIYFCVMIFVFWSGIWQWKSFKFT